MEICPGERGERNYQQEQGREENHICSETVQGNQHSRALHPTKMTVDSPADQENEGDHSQEDKVECGRCEILRRCYSLESVSSRRVIGADTIEWLKRRALD